MMIRCPFHGLQMGMSVSRDLWVGPESEPRHDEVVSLVYTCDGMPWWCFYVSRAFAEQHGLVGGVAEMPDDPNEFGDWDREMWCCCDKCFKSAYGGHFHRVFRWCADKATK